uniref:Uncharacterized protein n=1 Tax=Phytophthora fragariae TaxID=53985 RepID=A0A6A3EF80_9STRA|nr:hypothetical protein PF009_g21107 [Phytophthora fragariae]
MTSVSMVSVFTSSVPTCSPVGWRLSTTTDPFELFEEARSLSGVSDAQARSGRDSDASSERMDRIEGLLEGMAAKFAAQQLQMQTQLQQVTEAQRAQQAPRSSGHRFFATSSEHGSGTFGDYMKARDRSMGMGSLDESEGARPASTRLPHATQEPEPFRAPKQNPPPHGAAPARRSSSTCSTSCRRTSV